eukprot:TRINITY_DN1429_c0_g1_i1.p1 TRINITY_DN1429_c0_g1~~TRINITY_DN1429_c0_g1_i1.p1  ORF type:complete len:239 (-),score=100.08 TRINITY_DN1429_c0_g1_i1:89-724(-)
MKIVFLLFALFFGAVLSEISQSAESIDDASVEQFNESEESQDEAVSNNEEGEDEEEEEEEIPTPRPGPGAGFSRFKGDKLAPKRVPQDVFKTSGKCPQVTETQRREQRTFQSLLRHIRKSLERNQPWSDWAAVITKCSMGSTLFESLSPSLQVQHSTETVNILKNELKVRQHQSALNALKTRPCNPFAVERSKMADILAFRNTIMANHCKK